ncbi:hypothetical protein [Clostridium tagluense]|uniref:hypothetical protein n=1 Tax=Clostridium tagluense TaxID=360422 RepID=UPI001CF0F380|nr:hypothetical protein [Clostridium tagluense]MCB2300062.1 hypothetical protein [Clostridium tagluense]
MPIQVKLKSENSNAKSVVISNLVVIKVTYNGNRKVLWLVIIEDIFRHFFYDQEFEI